MAGTITTGNFPQALRGGGGKKMRKSAKLRDMDPKGGPKVKKPKVKKPGVKKPKAKRPTVKKPRARTRATKPKARGKAIGAGLSALTEMPGMAGMPGPMEPPKLGG